MGKKGKGRRKRARPERVGHQPASNAAQPGQVSSCVERLRQAPPVVLLGMEVLRTYQPDGRSKADDLVSMTRKHLDALAICAAAGIEAATVGAKR